MRYLPHEISAAPETVFTAQSRPKSTPNIVLTLPQYFIQIGSLSVKL